MPAVEHPLDQDDVLQMFLALDTPPGFKAELIEGEVVVTPPPDGSHETAFSLLARQFFRKAAIDLDVSGNKGLIIASKSRFIPDGTVSPVGHFENAGSWAPAEGVLLVFEITSTNPHKDREPKRKGYASAGVPCYLLVDRSTGKVTLFTDPENGDYTAHAQADFGKPIDLPAPFSFTLDTVPLR
ncbi:Uma2 family endonuclease [Kitasatospora sp. NPDC005856]|uniref:Uma2 family endonuclease n=1 Tax=Kitasatospora sp. NPDC005856 TaxID=3154566 RepID=UPI0033ED9B3D